MPSRKGKTRKLFKEQGGYCPGCGLTLDEILVESRLTQDHVLPRSLGGTREHGNGNLVAVCDDCNQRKANKSPWDWFGDQHLIYGLYGLLIKVSSWEIRSFFPTPRKRKKEDTLRN